ncbi:glycosyltransferase family 4 protein [Larkinella sp. VNQ87]|uniref:glycosyltransferase family 4 protein n=1 Tax=Larkinella sp. VNQ87 TaxID=3400921 RepID=UPI003C0E2683
MARLRLSFYTNIPTPYQQDFFKALAEYFDLTVVYYAQTEKGRQWTINNEDKSYQVSFLNDTLMAKAIQNKIKDYHFSWSIIRQVLTDRSDYIILSGAYWIPNTMVALPILKAKGKVVSFLGERLQVPKTKIQKHLKSFVLLPLKLGINRLLLGGKNAIDTYSEFGFNLPYAFIPYNIDVCRFDKNYLNKQKIISLQLKYKSQGEFLLLSSGSLDYRKNMESLVRVVKKINGPIGLIIIGDGPNRSALENEVADVKNIHLAGFVQADELPYYYAIADAFVFASRYDGWGVVINEAIAAGLPVVSSNQVGAAQEWIKDGLNGYICDATNEESFKTAIETLLNAPDIRQKQSDYNRVFSEKTSSAYYAKYLYELVKQDLRR